jgi:single-stranded DNA-binding protein
MIDALIAGKLHSKPEERTSKNGRPFVTAKMRAAAGDQESLFVNVIAFDQAACTALLALGAGDSVAVSGSVTPKVWQDREGHHRPALDVVAHAVLTAYHVTRKRSAMQRQQDGDQRDDGMAAHHHGEPPPFAEHEVPY